MSGKSVAVRDKKIQRIYVKLIVDFNALLLVLIIATKPNVSLG